MGKGVNSLDLSTFGIEKIYALTAACAPARDA